MMEGLHCLTEQGEVRRGIKSGLQQRQRKPAGSEVTVRKCALVKCSAKTVRYHCGWIIHHCRLREKKRKREEVAPVLGEFYVRMLDSLTFLG